MSTFTRSQTQTLYSHLPGALFEHDGYGLCLVTDVICDPAEGVNRAVLFETVYDVLQTWYTDYAELISHFPDPRFEQEQYRVGVPRTIQFVPFPTVLECQRCGHVETLETLQQRPGPARCPRPGCQGSFRQIPLVQIHQCGRLEPITIRPCRKHGQADLLFETTGRVATCTWRCRLCGGAVLSGVRMTPCGCAWAKGATEAKERFMRNIRTNDSSLFYVQTRSFINLKEDKLKLLRQDPWATALLLARVWGLLAEPVIGVAEQRLKLGNGGEKETLLDPLIEQMLAQLGSDHPLVQQYLQAQAEQERLPGQKAVDWVVQKLGQAQAQTPPSRRLAEHVAVLETLQGWPVETVVQLARKRDDLIGALSAAEAGRFAWERLGLADLRCLFDFPMALGAVGYTRASGYPSRATLRPFQAASTEGKTPLYVLAAETEAILIRLDPGRVVAWLHHNGFVSAELPGETLASWVWLRQQVPELAAEPWQETWTERPGRAVRTLLHTISHLLLRHVEWSGFDPESIGEYLLPETLSLILYTNRYTEFTIGGLVTLFEQRLLNWLEAAYAEGASCLYDPFCIEEGGACVGCLHRRYNCEFFNEDLSRAVLYGGKMADGWEIKTGYWTM